MTTTTNAGERAIATAPLEGAIAAALESMWQAAEAAQEASRKGRDDLSDAWQADVMTQRPIVFVAVALPGETMAWLIDPNTDNEGVLEAHINHHVDLDANGEWRYDGPPNVAKRETWTRLYNELVEDVSRLVRERSGQALSDYRGWRSETD